MSFIKDSNVEMQVSRQSLNIVNNIENELHNIGLQTSGTSGKIVLNSALEDQNAVQIIASSTGDGGGVLIQSSYNDDDSIVLQTTDPDGWGGITLSPGNDSGTYIGNSNGLGGSSVHIRSGAGSINIASNTNTGVVNIGNTTGGITLGGPIFASLSTGYTYYSTVPSSGATCNSKVGTASFTTTIASGSTNTFTISNNCAGTVGIVSMTCATTVTGAIVQIQSITWTLNTNIAIVVRNVGSQSTGSVLFTFSFMSFN